MAIEGIGLNLHRLAGGQAASQAYGVGSAPAATGAPAQRADAVEISAAARELRSASVAAEAAPDVRDERVAALKAAVDRGVYQIDTAALAQKLLGAA
ncbi:MAG: flagellar biosynthesis anti-sigma factor FlgM [Dehalococcoidia bacterium]